MSWLNILWQRPGWNGGGLAPLSGPVSRGLVFKPGLIRVLLSLTLAVGFIAPAPRLFAQLESPLLLATAAPTNLTPPMLIKSTSVTNFSIPTKREDFNHLLAMSRFQVSSRDFSKAEANFEKLLAGDVPVGLQQTALFEMGQAVAAQNEWPRAQAIFTQYLQRWPGDARTPEIYLFQGRVFRQMGLPNLALVKFYGVMTTALSLKSDQVGYYKRLVLQAQVEVAETHYLTGKFKDAVDYYSRLLVQNDPSLDRAQIQFRLIRSLGAIKNHEGTANQARDFLTRYPASPEEPEVRYYLAEALKGQGRSAEALEQVLMFLKEQQIKTKDRPEVWTYWQQRVGNEIGNELYQEGDFVKALQVYLTLAQLDPAPTWRLPVNYQAAITYEKLLQPKPAMDLYRDISKAAAGLGTNAAPSLKAVVDMAGWRLNFLEWQERAEAFNHDPVKPSPNTNNLTLNQP